MNELRTYIKKNIGVSNYKLSIKYNYDNNEVIYKYLLSNPPITLLFKEKANDISLTYDNKKYSNIYEIYIILYNLTDYTHNIDYIDAYILKSNTHIDDIYNDYYDDTQKQLISHRIINHHMLKFISNMDDKNITLYYNLETIYDFDDILKKIDELILNQ
jgi:hypothetical protein